MPTLRWIARVLGLLIVSLVLLLAIGQRFNPLNLTRTELAMSGLFLMALSGMILLWRWEVIGGVLVGAGMLGFYGMNYVASGRLPSGPVFPVCFVPGALALVCSWISRKNTMNLA